MTFKVRITKRCDFGSLVGEEYILHEGVEVDAIQRYNDGSVRLVSQNSLGHSYNVPKHFYEEVEE